MVTTTSNGGGEEEAQPPSPLFYELRLSGSREDGPVPGRPSKTDSGWREVRCAGTKWWV